MPILDPVSFSAVSAETNRDSLVFSALSSELQRSMDSLRIEGQPAPFLIDYRFMRNRNYNMEVRNGVIVRDHVAPWFQRFNAEVLVGDYHRNNSTNSSYSSFTTSIPEALDYNNLRRTAWMVTDRAYKRAIADMEGKTQQRNKVTLPADEAALSDLLAAKPTTFKIQIWF